MTIGTSSSISYDPFSAEIDINVHAVWRLMRGERPAYRNERYGFWALNRLGAVLARLEARVAFDRTLTRFPRWDIVPSELVAVQTSTVRGLSSVPIHL